MRGIALAAVTTAVIASTGVWMSGWWRPASIPGIVSRQRDNVLLITLDTTRADHIGCYGYANARTPTLDRLARESVRFKRAYSHVPLTLPSHTSILTGLLPPQHLVRSNGGFHLEDRFETLATILKGQGYRTAAFVSAFGLDRRFGLARGFDTYDDHIQEDLPEGASLEAQRPSNETVAALDAWFAAEGRKPEPFFVRRRSSDDELTRCAFPGVTRTRCSRRERNAASDIGSDRGSDVKAKGAGRAGLAAAAPARAWRASPETEAPEPPPPR